MAQISARYDLIATKTLEIDSKIYFRIEFLSEDPVVRALPNLS